MKKLLVFDLDGTLAKIGKSVLSEDVEKLKILEKQGCRIAVCSGKPVCYLCGFMRQIGLKRPVLVGENGAAFQLGVELPPKESYLYPYSPQADQQLRKMKMYFDEACGDRIWYQPNEVELTPFPKDPEAFELLQKAIDQHPSDWTELDVYRHVDCFDLMPKEISKYNGVRFLTELLNVSRDDVIVYGDGINDIPMFRFAAVSVGIGKLAAQYADYTFNTIGEALTATEGLSVRKQD